MNNSDFGKKRSGMAQSRPARPARATVKVFGKRAGDEEQSFIRIEQITERKEGSRAFGSGNTSQKGRSRSDKGFRKGQVKEATGSKSRAAAAKVVEAVNSGMSLSEAFPLYCKELDARDTGFVKEIVYGTLRNRRILMNTLMPMFSYKITEKHRIVQALLLTAMYQIIFMRSPVHAVVAATVSACGECGHKSFTSLVNAILRRFLREGAELKGSDDPAVTYSFPDWLYARLINAYGEEKAEEIMKASGCKADMFLRVELSAVSLEDYINKATEAGFNLKAVNKELAPGCIVFDHALNIDEIPGFAEGLCSVQDISAQLAAPLLDLKKDEKLKILDCCCAPGGKTAHIADLSPLSEITALDVSQERLNQASGTLKRLKRKVNLKIADAASLSADLGEFDRILADVPCSGTGVIRRHPDIKWLRRDKDIEQLCAVQKEIMDSAFARLKKGGLLLYTTCSVLPEENIMQAEAFLKRHEDAEAVPFIMGKESFTSKQIFPGDNGGDGFFYALFRKK